MYCKGLIVFVVVGSDGQCISSGGRVLCVTGLGDSLAKSVEAAYRGLRRVRLFC